MSSSEDASPFTKCNDCGSIFVKHHKCGADADAGDGNLTVDARQDLSELDGGDPEDDVVYLRGRADTAYHEPADPDNPAAGAACRNEMEVTNGPGNTDRQWSDSTRGQARDNSPHHPCRRCHDLGSGDSE